ncbi:PREDICTED: abscisic acid receptor PYL8-like isoform X3 [Tarenaya hassleriana]|uniref:abscisic acid receptor PYL8-like isoform X3 n=1 Tax=Tarenaya hassleriana TaxID=28532 RepID=UPI00053C0849|nr:PREDICTED: abscisic acid receptor PYL8-like isoform X3 [Tarenaya hassleriana]
MNAIGTMNIAAAIPESEYIRRHHRHEPKENQCSSTLVKHIKAPVHLVWSLVRRFDQPQKYKPFISRCVVKGNLEIGTVREVDVKSGLPATKSTERLELLDDNDHILSIRIVGGDHRLKNYSSIISLHPETIDGRPDVSERLAVQDRTEPIGNV